MAEVLPSPNIWRAPDLYERENRGIDPEGLIDAALRRVRDWAGGTVLDIGCGSGFHLPRFAATAAQVIGVEPHPPLVALARRRLARLGLTGPPRPDQSRVSVRRGTAQALPVRDASVDVATARWAYFFGPGCEPGLRELNRVLRRGGAASVVDVDASRSTFGRWFRQALPGYDPLAVERFWARQGWTRTPLTITWGQPSRAEFEAVARIEFPAPVADRFLHEHAGCQVDYAVNIWHRGF